MTNSSGGLGTNRAHRFVVKRPSWVEIQLVDEDENPVADAEYTIELPGGSTETGKLDANGFARHETKQAGNCRVVFQDIQASDLVTAGEPSPVAEPPPPLEWVEIKLEDTNGRSLGGEKFRVEVPDAEPITGELDEFGRARVEDLEPGLAYKVVFPGIDAADFVEE